MQGRLGPGLGQLRLAHVDVAGRAGAGAVAVGVDPADIGAFHDGEAGLHTDDVFRAVVLDEQDLGNGPLSAAQATTSFMETERSASFALSTG